MQLLSLLNEYKLTRQQKEAARREQRVNQILHFVLSHLLGLLLTNCPPLYFSIEHRIRRNCRICCLQKRKHYTALSLVQNDVIALGSQMASVQMVTVAWHQLLVGCQLGVPLLNFLRQDPTLDVKMDTLGKQEGCRPHHWILLLSKKRIHSRMLQYVALSWGHHHTPDWV